MLRRMGDDDLARVLAWRNQPAVRRNMYTTHEIAPAEHQAWWLRTRDDPAVRCFIYEDDGVPSGVVAFTRIDPVARTAQWAFYAAGDARRGIGVRMEVAALRHAFGELGLRELGCEVLSHNLRVVQMHEKFGFRVTEVLKGAHRGEEGPLDIYRLVMSADEWRGGLAERAERLMGGGRPAAADDDCRAGGSPT